MYKVPLKVLKDIKASLVMTARPFRSPAETADLGHFLRKRKSKAEKLIKLLEENYDI